MIQKLGLCAHFSRQGDWAFHFAFQLARRRNLHLNIFHWLDSPYRYHRDLVFKDGSQKELIHVTQELILQKELELREYYDDLLGEFDDVGFRLCEGTEDSELIHCLRRLEYEALVIGYQERGILFGANSIEEFAERFRAPVVLVGPDRPHQFYLNEKAVKIIDELDLPAGKWQPLSEAGKSPQTSGGTH